MRRIGKILGMALLLLAALGAAAVEPKAPAMPTPVAVTIVPNPANVNPGCLSATAAHCVDLSWTAPTTHTDGTPITGTLAYTISRAATATGAQTVLTSPAISATSYEDATVAGGSTWYYFLIAVETVNGVQGPASAQAATGAVVVPLSTPNAPGGITAKAS